MIFGVYTGTENECFHNELIKKAVATSTAATASQEYKYVCRYCGKVIK